jgi:transposase
LVWLLGRDAGGDGIDQRLPGDYWKGACYLLEAAGFDCWLVNAREVKNVPGRPKTDKHDAVWLARLTWGRRARHVPAVPGPSQADPPAA